MNDREPSNRTPRPQREEGRGSKGRLAALIGAAVLLVAVGALGAVVVSGGSDEEGNPKSATFVPEPVAVGDRPFADGEVDDSYPVAHVRRSRRLYDRPGGKPKVRIKSTTSWKSPRILSVVKRRGEWVAVLVPELRNGEVGWIRRRDVSSFGTVSWSLHADVSKRELVVRRAGKTVRRFRVAVGRKGHSTPKGRFAVTDRLRVRDPSSPYGCCVLALTGHQTRLPAGWPGGDRLAVHATKDLSGIGNAVSLGCLRSHPRHARWLIRMVPIGSPVFIRS